jgi:hypothetical protein
MRSQGEYDAICNAVAFFELESSAAVTTWLDQKPDASTPVAIEGQAIEPIGWLRIASNL